MKKMLLAIVLLPSTTVSHADDSQIVIASDSSSGTYKKMLGEIISVCSTENFNIQEAKGVTGGAVGNLDALKNNQAQAAFLHADVFVANATADVAYKRFKTLVALYPEPIHVLTLRESKITKGGMMGIGKKTVEFNSLADMAGYNVGAAGGGTYTARILIGSGQAGFNLSEFQTGAAAIAALDSGEVAGVIFVGAAPLPNIEKLDKSKYKLVTVGESIASRVKGLYRTGSINYPGLTSGPVPTLAAMALIMTRQFNTPKKIAAQRHFRECFNQHLNDLKDTGSPNWQEVEPNDHGNVQGVDWYDLPK